jgi:hypothetical protein
MKGFKAFLLRGNLIDLAVAVVIGVAFNNVVQALITDIITPHQHVLLRRFHQRPADLPDHRRGHILPGRRPGEPDHGHCRAQAGRHDPDLPRVRERDPDRGHAVHVLHG